MVITRITFAGAGTDVGLWLGDNLATWFHYRISIAQMLEFGAMFQMPMVGADVCGFGTYDTTEQLCARWAVLGAFYPFYRNHGDYNVVFHEFYLRPSVAEAAREAIDRRFRLLDYLYTAFYQQTIDGTPLMSPLFFVYPEDETTFPIYLQFFYGDALLVSPVTEDNGTSVTFYLPNDTFYDFFTLEQVQNNGSWVTVEDMPLSAVLIHIRRGAILPMRVENANTTTELRTKDFELIVAPGANVKANGQLYLDDGDSIQQNATSLIKFTYEGGRLEMNGTFDYDVGSIAIAEIIVLGIETKPTATGTADLQGTYNATAAYWSFNVSVPLTGP